MDRNPIKLLKADYSTIELATLLNKSTWTTIDFTSTKLYCQSDFTLLFY